MKEGQESLRGGRCERIMRGGKRICRKNDTKSLLDVVARCKRSHGREERRATLEARSAGVAAMSTYTAGRTGRQAIERARERVKIKDEGQKLDVAVPTE